MIIVIDDVDSIHLIEEENDSDDSISLLSMPILGEYLAIG